MSPPGKSAEKCPLVCVGDAGVDVYVGRDLVRPGGCTLNVAFNLLAADPDLPVSVIAPVGDDPMGERLRSFLGSAPFPCHFPESSGSPPTQYLELSGEGERHFLRYEEGALRGARLDETAKEMIQGARAVITVVFEQNVAFVDQILAASAESDALVVCDFMNLSDWGPDPVSFVAERMDTIDLAFFGLEESQVSLQGQLSALAEGTGKTLVVTLGAAGSVAYRGGEKYEAAAFATRVVDTTGAGDSFLAAFLASHVRGEGIPKALRAGHRRAAHVVGILGAFETFPL